MMINTAIITRNHDHNLNKYHHDNHNHYYYYNRWYYYHYYDDNDIDNHHDNYGEHINEIRSSSSARAHKQNTPGIPYPHSSPDGHLIHSSRDISSARGPCTAWQLFPPCQCRGPCSCQVFLRETAARPGARLGSQAPSC